MKHQRHLWVILNMSSGGVSLENWIHDFTKDLSTHMDCIQNKGRFISASR